MQIPVKMEMFGWLEVGHQMKDEWKCVLKGDGELCVMMDGLPLMLKSYVDNWAIAHRVIIQSIHLYSYSESKRPGCTEQYN